MSGSARLSGFGRWSVRAAGRCLARGGRDGRLAILIYHRVLAQADPLYPGEVDQAAFAWQVELLARCFRVLPLEEAVTRLQAGTLPPRAVCITFDDGYRDNHDVALPILKRWGAPATFFVTTGFLDGGCMWNDAVFEAVRGARGPTLDLVGLGLGSHDIADMAARRRTASRLVGRLKYENPETRSTLVARVIEAAGASPPADLMMNRSHVRALHEAGMSIGAHTVSHPILARLDKAAAGREIATSRAVLEEILGRPVTLFAYPNGVPGVDYAPEHVELVRSLGFRAAVSTAWGVATRVSSPFELPRFTPWDMTPGRFALRLLHNFTRTALVVPPAAAAA